NGTGNDDINNLFGNALNNTLDGKGGADIIAGGEGADNLIGGTGNDTYYVDVAGDSITEAVNEGSDIVYLIFGLGMISMGIIIIILNSIL
ncbi:MAG: hypothetical protein HGA23_12530, partial [Bacteroidales bacterium]|nr:hypothetical protein [Bacteroidales bacterium]